MRRTCDVREARFSAPKLIKNESNKESEVVGRTPNCQRLVIGSELFVFLV